MQLKNVTSPEALQAAIGTTGGVKDPLKVEDFRSAEFFYSLVRRRTTMNDHRILSALLGVIVSAGSVAAQSGVMLKDTVGEFLLRSERDAAVPFVQYCASALPENKDALESEYAKFQERFQAAAVIFMQRHGNRPDLSKRAPTDLVNAYQQGAKRTLAQIKKKNPREYCPWLLTTFTAATPDAIQARLDKMLIQYEVLKLD